MMKTSKKGFTLAEVLTTLMVIGVVAAMTIPTLINSTDAQQQKAALRKAVSVLGQAIQLNIAKEVECGLMEDGEDLAACMSNSLAGMPNGDTITTADGISYKFYVPSRATGTTISALCGENFNPTKEGWMGAGNCGVEIDTNGLSKGTTAFSGSFSDSGFTSEPAGSDQFTLSMTAIGVRPTFSTISDEGGYTYMYGKPASTNVVYGDGKSCKCEWKAADAQNNTATYRYTAAKKDSNGAYSCDTDCTLVDSGS